MDPWTIELLPKINCDLKELRRKAREIGYSVKTRITSFQDLARVERRSWCLSHPSVDIKPGNIYFDSTIEKHRVAFDLIEEVTKKNP